MSSRIFKESGTGRLTMTAAGHFCQFLHLTGIKLGPRGPEIVVEHLSETILGEVTKGTAVIVASARRRSRDDLCTARWTIIGPFPLLAIVVSYVVQIVFVKPLLTALWDKETSPKDNCLVHCQSDALKCFHETASLVAHLEEETELLSAAIFKMIILLAPLIQTKHAGWKV